MAITDWTLKNVHIGKDKFLKKIGLYFVFSYLKKGGVTASHITILGGVFALFAIYYVGVDLRIYALLLLSYIFLDAIDGTYARYTNDENDLGEKIDHTIDAAFEIFLEVRIAFLINEWWAYIVPLLFILDLAYIKITKTDRFPARYGMYLAIFGWFRAGLIIQAILPIITIPLNQYALKQVSKNPTKL